jgi:choline dehydrogenase-like flavoprotein
MLLDFNEAFSRAAATKYDVCVCGTGPAGITTARKLAASGKRVLLLEAGGLEYSDESQDHYKGKTIGTNPFWWLESGRLRYFGGASNHWGGLCAMMDPITFEKEKGDGLPGWPIPQSELLASFDEAKEILEIPNADYTPRKKAGLPSPDFNEFSVYDSPPVRFGQKYRDEIKQSQQIDAFINANVVDIRLTDDLSTVAHIRVQNYKGDKVDVTAEQYVIAFGGLESPRALLNANSQMPAGVGNHSGMVGRCFMEGLNVPLGRFVVTDPSFWGTDVRLVPTPEFMRRNDVDNGVLDFAADATSAGIGYGGRLKVVKEFVRDTGCYLPAVRDVARKIIDFDCVGDGLITTLIEQQPNPNSRITLGDDVDSFGLRRSQIDWTFTERDYKTIRTLAVAAAKAMAQFDRARVQLAKYITDRDMTIGPIGGQGHHMGTTRMSADPRYGVVDENCKVHGLRNLYVVGASVFSRCGGRNPTMTVVLLSIRLGKYLSKMA